jgi:hypothetical protein
MVIAKDIIAVRNAKSIPSSFVVRCGLFIIKGTNFLLTYTLDIAYDFKEFLNLGQEILTFVDAVIAISQRFGIDFNLIS